MTNQEIEKLRGYCEDFKSFRQNTEDGSGTNLHDIKNTFNYVRKTLDTYNLVGTAFGSELSKKAEQAANVLSELWLCLQNLEISVENFCDEQEKNNGTEYFYKTDKKSVGYDVAYQRPVYEKGPVYEKK